MATDGLGAGLGRGDSTPTVGCNPRARETGLLPLKRLIKEGSSKTIVSDDGRARQLNYLTRLPSTIRPVCFRYALR